MAGRLALVPELGECDNRDPAQSPPRNFYLDLIRNVGVVRRRCNRQPVHTGSTSTYSSYSTASGASNSYFYQPNNSNCSSRSCSRSGAIADFGAHDHELTKIARRMVSEGYAQRMVTAFGGGPDRARLETWFMELDVHWVLQLHEEHGLPPDLQDKSAASHQELIERWIRALTVIAVSIVELVLIVTVDEMPAVARFGKASMAKMLVFVGAIIPALEADMIGTLVDMYIWVSSASYRFTPLLISREAQTILDEIGRSLSREVISLREAISSATEAARTFIEDEDSKWAIAIRRGRGEVHECTRLMVDFIRYLVKAKDFMQNTSQSHDTAYLHGLIHDYVHYLKDLLLRKSDLCLDLSLRYLFLLNNFYLVTNRFEPFPGGHWGLTPECKKFMDSYLDVSWGHVLSHVQKMVFVDSTLDVSCGPVLFGIPRKGLHGSGRHRKNTSSLAKFNSAFHQMYQAQKFWKVPFPRLRHALRESITEKVISVYGYYLEKHPDLEKHISCDRVISAPSYWYFMKKNRELENLISSSPNVLKEMLAELFER
ncbi:hypothetical protein ACQ4PT_050017 [Festuca glaucescens]